MKISSRAFSNGETIPIQYTCQGKGISPPLSFSDIPKEARSLVLLVDDPDVPTFVRPDRMFDHWVLYNIPPQIRELQEDSAAGTEGKNTSGKIGYYGPCPPDREHRYFFKLYALDTILDLPEGATKKEVEKAIAGHILAKAELMGRYEKRK